MEILLIVKNWESFQSYKDRRPPWVRLHKSLLDDYEFQSMSANARALLPMIWLIASEDKDPQSGCVRGSYESVTFRLRGNLKDVKAGIQEIAKAGFVTLKNQDKDKEKPLVTQNAQSGYETVTPETETETETETEAYLCERAFQNCWGQYPRKVGNKKKARESFKNTVWKKGRRIHIFLEKMGKYIKSVDDPQYYKHGDTFFRNWEDLEIAEPIVAKPKKKTTVRHNLDLIKNIDLGGNVNDSKRVQNGDGDNIRIGTTRQFGAGNGDDLERVTN